MDPTGPDADDSSDDVDREEVAARDVGSGCQPRSAARLHEEALVYLKQAVALFAEVGEPERHEPEIWKLVDW